MTSPNENSQHDVVASSSGERMHVWAVRGIVAFSLIATIAMGIKLLYGFYFTPDYTVFWTASRMVLVRPQDIYDVNAMTAAQSIFIPPHNGPRPWAYPPSALLFFLPFSIFPFWLSAAMFLAVSLGAYLWAIRRYYVSGKGLILTLASPAVLLSALPVQTSLLIAAGILTGIAIAKDRAILSGAVMGLVAAFKPQTVILFPLMCLIQKNWKALVSFISAGLAVVAGSFSLGFGLWIDWISSLDDFHRIVGEMGLLKRSMTPIGIAASLNFSETMTVAIQILGAILGIVFAVWAFRQEDFKIHVAGLVCGGLMCSPYAMYYELAPLAPLAVIMLYSRRPWGLVASLPLTTMAGMFTVPLMAVGFVMDRKALAGKQRESVSRNRDATTPVLQ